MVDDAVRLYLEKSWRWKFLFPSLSILISFEEKLGQSRHYRIFLWQIVRGDFTELITGPNEISSNSRFNLDLCITQYIQSRVITFSLFLKAYERDYLFYSKRNKILVLCISILFLFKLIFIYYISLVEVNNYYLIIIKTIIKTLLFCQI